MVEPTIKIKWEKSEAKAILEYDLAEGFLSMDETKCPAQFAWDTYYRHLPQFKMVPFKQFEDQLEAHRNSFRFKLGRAFRDPEAFVKYHRNHPTQARNKRGELNYDASPAKKLLREDVKNKEHEDITPTEFQQSRNEYAGFKKRNSRNTFTKKLDDRNSSFTLTRNAKDKIRFSAVLVDLIM